MFKDFFDKKKLFLKLKKKKSFKSVIQQALLFTILFLALYGLIYGYFVNGMSMEWALKDLLKFPATFLLTILFSSPAYHLLSMIMNCKKGFKETFAIMLIGTMIMSTFSVVFGGVLLTLMGINRTAYGIMQATNAGVILFGCLLGALYFYFGLRITHQLSENAAIALVLICGIIYMVMLPQAAGLIGPYSIGEYGGGFLEGMSGAWGAAQMTRVLR